MRLVSPPLFCIGQLAHRRLVIITAMHASLLILRESHAVLHTWPETGTINIDIFSCTPRLRSVEAINELGRVFGARHLSMQEIARADGHGPRRDAGR
jgi:S-adenosylmethionine/arginine decarboxylase-like enzyme